MVTVFFFKLLVFISNYIRAWVATNAQQMFIIICLDNTCSLGAKLRCVFGTDICP